MQSSTRSAQLTLLFMKRACGSAPQSQVLRYNSVRRVECVEEQKSVCLNTDLERNDYFAEQRVSPCSRTAKPQAVINHLAVLNSLVHKALASHVDRDYYVVITRKLKVSLMRLLLCLMYRVNFCHDP
ncbi:hypothetical protein MIR68_009398 [Amoeboaphelidium protococcarum]|nr:hypothetical protein MIR68_009398 [Amoeboaphelidium protococcarum]